LVETIARVADSLGAPAAVTEGGRVEFALNAVAFAPVSLLGTLLWPRWTWRDWTAAGFVASFLVEGFQAIFLSARSATYVDVVSNTLGALIGAFLAVLLVRAVARQRSEHRTDLPDRASTAQQDELPG
jgi:glycopeptide antibiotics resistance protein